MQAILAKIMDLYNYELNMVEKQFFQDLYDRNRL